MLGQWAPTNSLISAKLYVQHLGEKHLKERGHLHNRGIEKDGKHDDWSTGCELQSGPAHGVGSEHINRRICSDRGIWLCQP